MDSFRMRNGQIERIDPKEEELQRIEAELEEKDTVSNKLKGVLGAIGNEITSISGYRGRRPPNEKQTLSDKLSEIEGLKRYRQRLKTETDPEIKRETRGKVPNMKKGGAVKSASKRADGCAQRGKTKGRYI